MMSVRLARLGWETWSPSQALGPFWTLAILVALAWVLFRRLGSRGTPRSPQKAPQPPHAGDALGRVPEGDPLPGDTVPGNPSRRAADAPKPQPSEPREAPPPYGTVLSGSARSTNTFWLAAAALLLLHGARPSPGSQADSVELPWQQASQMSSRSNQSSATPYTHWDRVGARLPVRTPRGWLRDGDWILLHAEARQDRWAARPGTSAEPYRWVADPGQVRVWRSPQAPTLFERILAGIATVRGQAAQRLAQLDAGPPDEGPPQGLARALLLGWDAVDPAWKDRFTRTGTRHLLALSGLHVGILWWLLVQPIAACLARLGPLGWRRAIRSGTTLLGLLALVPFLGAGTPCLRAALAYGLAAQARCMPATQGSKAAHGRRGDGLSLWGFALALEQALHPDSILEIGLQLSYAATLGLILWAKLPRAQGWQPGGISVSSPTPPKSLPVWVMTDFPGLRSGLMALRDGFLASWRASWIATATTFPLIAWHFGEWSPVGPLATLALMPLVILAIASGLVWWLVPFALPKDWAAWPFEAMGHVVAFADRMPGTAWILPTRPALWIGATGLCLLLAVCVGTLRRRERWLRAALFLMALGLLPWTPPPRTAWAGVADVGHGTAVLLRFPCGRTVVFDGGSRDRRGVGRRVLHPWLRREDPGSLQIALSHNHRDHASALTWLAQRVAIEAWIGAEPDAGIPDHTRAHLAVRTGQTLGPPCPLGRCRVEWWRGWEGPGNEGSGNLLVEWDGVRMFLCGDAEDLGLEPLLAQLASLGPVLAWLVPHHGSEQPHWEACLAALRPEQLWFSATEQAPLARASRANPPTRGGGDGGPYETRVRWTAQDGGWIQAFTKPDPGPGEKPVTLIPMGR